MTNATKKLITELSDDYGGLVHAVGRMTKNIGDHGDDAITGSARGFVHAASKLADSLKQQTVNLAKEAGEDLRGHPITAAALAAAAVGLLGFGLTGEHK